MLQKRSRYFVQYKYKIKIEENFGKTVRTKNRTCLAFQFRIVFLKHYTSIIRIFADFSIGFHDFLGNRMRYQLHSKKISMRNYTLLIRIFVDFLTKFHDLLGQSD